MRFWREYVRKEFIFYFFPSPVGSNRNVGTSNGSTFFSAETNFWKIQFSFFSLEKGRKMMNRNFAQKRSLKKILRNWAVNVVQFS